MITQILASKSGLLNAAKLIIASVSENSAVKLQ
jgi:hypothetical protein